MSGRPFMQLYVSDFVGDTLALSAELVGAYLLLLMSMWNGDGTLPNEPDTLSRIARIRPENWDAAWAKLAPYFEVEPSKISHGRLAAELAKFARKSAARKDAGSRGGKAKALKDKGSTVANATANAIASSRNQNKKGRATPSDPTEGVRLDRFSQEVLFKACEAISGPVPEFIQFKTFPAEVYMKAVESMTLVATGESQH